MTNGEITRRDHPRPDAKAILLAIVALLSIVGVSCVADQRGPGGPPGSGSEQRGQSGDRREGRGGPPQEAIEACSEKSKGDSCSFSGRRGEEVTGTCIPDQEQLACAPEGGPPGGRQRRR